MRAFHGDSADTCDAGFDYKVRKLPHSSSPANQQQSLQIHLHSVGLYLLMYSRSAEILQQVIAQKLFVSSK